MTSQEIARRAGQALLSLQFASFFLLMGPYATLLNYGPALRGLATWMPLGLWIAYIPLVVVLVGLVFLRRAARQDRHGLARQALVQASVAGTVGALFLMAAIGALATGSTEGPHVGLVLITTPLLISGLLLAVAAWRLGAVTAATATRPA